MLEPMKAIEWQEGPIEMRLAPTKEGLLQEIDRLLAQLYVWKIIDQLRVERPGLAVPRVETYP